LVILPSHGLGFTTIALPPPRRTGSAAASSWSPGTNSIPVAAPISGVVLNSCPGERLGDAKDGGRGHGRVDRVAAATQRVDGSLCRQGVDGRGSPAGSRRGRRTVRSHVRRGSDL
jgi:hypothetical protein